MNAIIRMIRFLITGLTAGVDWVKQTVPDEAKRYLGALEKFTYISIIVPALFMGLGFLSYWIFTAWLEIEFMRPLWRILILLGGVFALLFSILLAVLATPIGALISSATEPPKGAVPTPAEKLPWYRWFSPIGTLREIRGMSSALMQSVRSAIERYIDAVKIILVVESFGFFFFGALPRPSVTILLLCTMGVSAIWFNRAYRGVWAWLAQTAALAVMGCYLLVHIFPKLNPFVYFAGSSPEELTMEGLRVQVTSGLHWASRPHSTATLIALVVVSLALVYVVTMLIRAVIRTMPAGTASATGTDPHGAVPPVHDTSHGGGHGGAHSSGGGNKFVDWLIVGAISIFILWCIVSMYGRWKNWDTLRDMKIDAQAELHRVREEARQQATPVPAPSASVASATRTGVEPQVWCGLKSPTKHLRTLTSTNWCEDMPKPWGMWVKFSPASIATNLQVRINGKKELPVEADGSFTFPPEATSFAFKLQSGEPVRTTIGVGNKAD